MLGVGQCCFFAQGVEKMRGCGGKSRASKVFLLSERSLEHASSKTTWFHYLCPSIFSVIILEP